MQRPHVAPRAGEFHRVEQPVHGAARRLVGALHGGEVGVGAHIVRRQEQVGNRRGGLGAQRPGADEIHQQRLGIIQKTGADRILLDVRVEEPGVEVLVAQHLFADIHRALELHPRLTNDLLARALHGRAPVRSRRRPVGHIDREDTPHVAVAELLGRNAAPELELRNARQRPFGVDVDDVSMCGRNLAAQIILYAVHPLDVGSECPQVGQGRVGGQQAAVHHRGDALERERRHVMVAAPHGPLALPERHDAADPAAVAQNLHDLRVGDILHAAGFQIGAPRIDPDEIGGAVEHLIGRPGGRIDDREDQLHEDVADGARARGARLGGHQRTGDAGGEEFLIRRRSLLGADEIPPSRPFILPEPALLARGQNLPNAGAEEGEIVGREVGDRSEGQEHVAHDRAGIGRRARKRRRDDKGRLAVLRDADARGRYQVIGHLATVERRNAAHGVDDVLIEPGEKPEAVLAGQVVLDRSNSGVRNLMPAAAGAVVHDRNAARLAARDVAPFEDHDLEAALDEFLRGAHARHAAAQNDNSRGHGSVRHS